MSATQIRKEIATTERERNDASAIGRLNSDYDRYLSDKMADLRDDLYVAEHPEEFDDEMPNLRAARMNYRAELAEVAS